MPCVAVGLTQQDKDLFARVNCQDRAGVTADPVPLKIGSSRSKNAWSPSLEIGLDSKFTQCQVEVQSCELLELNFSSQKKV